MGPLFSYSIYSSIILLGMYICYKWVMAGENQHLFNRCALWLIYVISLLAFPLSHIARSFVTSSIPEQPYTDIDIEGIIMTHAADDIVDTSIHSVIITTILGIYIIGALLVFCHTVWVGLRLARLISDGEKSRCGKYILVLTEDNSIAPFSWCRFIVMSKHDWTQSGEVIATHESQHLCLWHWLDLLLAQIVAILQWYNPAAWLMREELRAVHEYQADSAVIKTGVNVKDYQMLLIRKAVGERFPSLANSLNHSKLKKRIIMMYNSKSTRLRRLGGLALVPACAAALFVTSIPAVAGFIYDSSSASLFEVETSVAPTNDALSDGAEKTDAPNGMISEAKGPNWLDEIKVAAVGTENKFVASAAASTPTTAQVSARDEKVYDVVETKPKFPGGEKELMKYIAKNIRYPELAYKEKIQGRVILQFVVTSTGSIGDVRVVRGKHPLLDEEAVRVVKSLPNFIPGGINGKPVSVWYTIPIIFKITEDKVDSAKKMDMDTTAINPAKTHFFLDGVEVSYDQLTKISPENIQSIDVNKEDGTVKVQLKTSAD